MGWRQGTAKTRKVGDSLRPGRGPLRLSWARLLKRAFDLDLEHCLSCGGELKIIAAILEQPVIEKIPMHLGLQARAPLRSPVPGRALQAA